MKPLSSEDISQRLASIQESLTPSARLVAVSKFHLLTEPLSVERGELTNTLKVRRKVVAELYAAEIASMYEE